MGIFIFEVKDFSIDNILNFNNEKIIHNAYGVVKEFQLVSLRDIQISYLNRIKSVFDKENTISINWAMIFPNITRKEIDSKCEIPFEELIKSKDKKDIRRHYNFFFKDDIEFTTDDFETEKNNKINIFEKIRFGASILTIEEERACLQIIQYLKVDNFNFKNTNSVLLIGAQLDINL
jgi:hypothetical protein